MTAACFFFAFYCFLCWSRNKDILNVTYYVHLYFAEKLRRKDAEVAKALEEKERLIADILHIPPPPSSSTSIDVYGRSCSDDIDNDMTSSDALNQQQITDKDATKVLLAALEQGSQQFFYINVMLRRII